MLKLYRLLAYMKGLQRAEVEIEEKGGVIRYNGVEGVGEFASRILELEMAMWPVLDWLLDGEQAKGRHGRLVQGYAEALEVVLNICGAEKVPHLYLEVRRNGQRGRWEQLSRDEQEVVEGFVQVQQGSFLRYGLALEESRKMVGASYSLRPGLGNAAWMELGNALFTTGMIVASGSKLTKKAFMMYWFRVVNAVFPPNYDRQMGQIQERVNGTVFLGMLSKEYQKVLAERER